MQQSANYALKLPEGTDNVKRQDFVDNFTNIDSQMKIINDNGYANVTATGTNAYVGSTDRIKSLGKGTKLTLFVGTDATGNCSLNLNSYGMKNIKDSFGNIVNNIKANIPYNLCYNGTDFILQGKGGGGNATAAQILKDKTATVDSGPVTGTLDLTNLVTGNIKSGVTINGVAGSSTVVDTADAVLDPAYLVTGYSGYDDGVKKNGMMSQCGNIGSPDGSGFDSLIGSNAYNSTVGRLDFRNLPLQFINGNMTIHIKDLLPQYIVSGITVGGVNGIAGTATIESLGGRQIASGTSLLPYYMEGSTYCYYLDLSGLSFTPTSVYGTWYSGAYPFVALNNGSRLISIYFYPSNGFAPLDVTDMRRPIVAKRSSPISITLAWWAVS